MFIVARGIKQQRVVIKYAVPEITKAAMLGWLRCAFIQLLFWYHEIDITILLDSYVRPLNVV